MNCPHFEDERMSGTTAQCVGVIVPFEPSRRDQIDFCTSGRQRHCPLYRSASQDLSLAIHREVTRAIG